MRHTQHEASPDDVVWRRVAVAAALAASTAGLPPAGLEAGGVSGPAADVPTAVCRAARPPGAGAGAPADPDRIPMTSTGRARGAAGTMILRLASSPYGVALSSDGSYRYHVEISVRGLPDPGDGTHVVWAATPELDQHRKLGVLGTSGSVSGQVDWNKFLVFVTAERSGEVESWSQRILLSVLSPSGRMHTMAGHGPFSGEPCLDPRQ